MTENVTYCDLCKQCKPIKTYYFRKSICSKARIDEDAYTKSIHTEETSEDICYDCLNKILEKYHSLIADKEFYKKD